MRQYVTAVALSCALFSTAGLATTAHPTKVANAAVADIYLDYTAKVNVPTSIPVDTHGREAYITVKVDDNWSSHDSKVEVSWNGSVVSGGDMVKVGSAVIFHVSGAGTLTIKNLNTSESPDSWYDDTTIYGEILINII